MKLPCAVIRDLLPLYAEKMTEPETHALIEEHLRECPECQKKAASGAAETIAAVDSSAPLHTLKKELSKRRWFAALIAGLLVFVLIFTYFYHADSLQLIPWEDGLITVKGVETISPEDRFGHQYQSIGGEGTLPPHEYTGEALILLMDSRITGTETEYIEDDDGSTIVILQGFGRKNASHQGDFQQDGEMRFYPVPDRLIYGYEQPQKMLWGDEMNGGVEVLPRLVLSYYMLLSVLLAAVTGCLWLMLRKKQWSWIPRQVFFAPLSYLMAHLLLKGLCTISFFVIQDFLCILLNACALYGLITLLWQVILKRRQENGLFFLK